MTRLCTHLGLERMLFALAGSVTLLSVAVALTVSPWFLLVTGLTGLNQWAYALVGDCPASLVLRHTACAGGGRGR